MSKVICLHVFMLISSVCSVQDRHMVRAACDAIAVMGYIIPDVVLPLVYERFQVRSCSLYKSLEHRRICHTLSQITDSNGFTKNRYCNPFV